MSSSSSSQNSASASGSRWNWPRSTDPESSSSSSPSSGSNASLFSTLLKLGDTADTGAADVASKEQDELISKLLLKARQTASSGCQDNIPETSSFQDVVNLMSEYRGLMGSVLDKYIGSVVDWKQLTAAAAFYYMEYEDEVKNPSWKRRKHRFYPGIDINKVEMANEALDMALIAYADTAQEVHDQLDQHPSVPCDVLAVEVNSVPGKPAHFVALPRDQSTRNPDFKNSLHVLIVVRGTKTVADAITDLLGDVEDYRGGKAHSFILQSGKYLYDKYKDFLRDLLAASGKSKLKLDFVGHSLGAGAASIAGMEFHHHCQPQYEVEVVGFGSPAILSPDLANPKATPYIITVINDSDVVPRLSGPTAANLLVQMLRLDWLSYAKRDIQEAMAQLHATQPTLFPRMLYERVENQLGPMIHDYFRKQEDAKLRPPADLKFEVELLPPGRCIHLYRDGYGISGHLVPNAFFQEIDISRRMLDDHLFHTGYQQTLLELVRQVKRDHHFAFRSTAANTTTTTTEKTKEEGDASTKTATG